MRVAVYSTCDSAAALPRESCRSYPGGEEEQKRREGLFVMRCHRENYAYREKERVSRRCKGQAGPYTVYTAFGLLHSLEVRYGI